MKPNSEPADETLSETQAPTEAAATFTPTPSQPVAPVTPNAAAPDADAIRAQAAEVAQICAQAARLGVSIDTADAVKRGLKPDALRSQVLENLAAASDAALIVATAPAAAEVKASSPVILLSSALALRRSESRVSTVVTVSPATFFLRLPFSSVE